MRDIEASFTSNPPQLSPQSYRRIEGVLLNWASDRNDALLLCEAHVHKTQSPIPPAFLLYLSPHFKALIQATPEPQLSFDTVTIRQFSQALQQQNQLAINLQHQLQQQLAEPWSNNTPDQHSLFSVALLQPLPETTLALPQAPPDPATALCSAPRE
ncbi:MAG: hypothetical protein HC771_15565 [Synechococcales cyanobacterium CRU_2_2]|nr:hypothetical protein [Synechococcales cyanobacterium CRU_2_2]